MSKIEWTGRTWNPTTGCDRVGPGCDNCYAMTMAARLKKMGQPKYQQDGDPRSSGPGFGLTLHPDVLDVPLKRKQPTTWFVDSMSDLFHPDVSSAFIGSVFDTMAKCPQHTFQVLTKRPQRMAALMRTGVPGQASPLPNVWLGASIENDAYTWRAGHISGTRAAVRFLSLEPLLGPLPSLDLTGIDWVIIGGESGRGARPMDLRWVRELLAQCREAGAAPFVKQLGSLQSKSHRDLKGGQIETWPEDLQVREMPEHAGAVA